MDHLPNPCGIIVVLLKNHRLATDHLTSPRASANGSIQNCGTQKFQQELIWCFSMQTGHLPIVLVPLAVCHCFASPHSFCSWSIFTKFVDQPSLVKRPTCFYSRSHSLKKVALHHPVDQRPPKTPAALGFAGETRQKAGELFGLCLRKVEEEMGEFTSNPTIIEMSWG